MKSIPTTPPSDKVILIHHGALGDFLAVWPSAWAVRRAFPDASLSFAGPGERLGWLAPLGFSLCQPEQRKALDRAHGADRWPEVLAASRCLWFVVDRVPALPAHPGLAFLRAVNGHAPARHVREEYARALAGLGVPTPSGWLEDFRSLFAATRRPSDRVLLFPGAGHPLKQWPLVQFFQLADMLPAHGLRPVFVLGPAELERGLVPKGREAIAPKSLEELERLLLEARGVAGGDTGPMHLAGMLGVPGVSLFGPTSFAQWGPVGMREMNLNLPCSPCTAACADLTCPAPRCLDGLAAPLVLEGLLEALEQSKTGFQDPGIS